MSLAAACTELWNSSCMAFALCPLLTAGAIEAIFSILAIRDNVAPPTNNLDNPSVETAIDLVPKKARQREINVALSNSFGFGGTNASLIVRRLAN